MDASNSTKNDSTNQDNIEDLLRTLHGQIKTSEWAQENEKKIENENPELIKAWKEAIEESIKGKSSSDN